MNTVKINLITLTFLHLLPACADSDPSFHSVSNKRTVQSQDQDASKIDSNQKSYIISKNVEKVIEVFNLTEREDKTMTAEISRDPLKSFECRQTPKAANRVDLTISGPSNQAAQIEQHAPTRFTNTLQGSLALRAIDIFVTIDNSETFNERTKDRAIATVQKIVSDLNDYNWKVFIGGLEGSDGGFASRTFSKSGNLANDLNKITAEVNDIWNSGALGDERTFHSLYKLTYNNRNNDRDNATKAYLIISDAPNCKNRQNQDSSLCANTSTDKYYYLLNSTPAPLNSLNKHQAILGAFYRRTEGKIINNSGEEESFCSLEDSLETGAGLSENSQYAQAVLEWEKFLFNPSATKATFVGDLCSANQNLSWVNQYVQAIKDLSDKRLILSNSFDTFAADPQYNLKIGRQGATLNSNEYNVIDGRVVILNTASSHDTVATYHHHNNYNKLQFTGKILPAPASGTSVTLATTDGLKQWQCHSSYINDQSICYYSGETLHLKNWNFMPTLAPGSNPVKLNLSWKTDGHKQNYIEIKSSYVIYPDSISVNSNIAGFNAVPQQILTNSGKTIRLTFDENLPVATYSAYYRDTSHYNGTCNIPDTQIIGDVVCHLPTTQAQLDSTNKISVDQSKLYNCNFDATNRRVSFGGIVPTDPKLGYPAIMVSYLNRNDPQKEFALEFIPDGQQVIVERGSIDDTTLQPLAVSSYKLSKNILTLNDALKSGEKLSVKYKYVPKLSGCFNLAHEAVDDTYDITFKYQGKVNKLNSKNYMIITKDRTSTLCVNEDFLKHGAQILASYVKTKTEDIEYE